MGQHAVPKLGGPAQIVGALGLVDLAAHLLEFLAQFTGHLDGGLFVLPLGLELVPVGLDVGDFLFELGEPFLRGGVLFLFQGLALDGELRHAPLERFQLLGHAFVFGAQFRGGFIHQVDCLVGQKTVRDVAMREHRGGHQRGILDPHAMVHLILFAQAAQNGDGVLDTRFIDLHRLKTAFERGVLLDVFAIFVQRGRADTMQFAAGQHRLEHVARIHRTLGLARADHGMNFVDEKNDLARRLDHLLEHGFEPLFKFTAKLCARNQRGEIERDDFLLLEAFRHVPGDNPLGEALHDGRLANTRFADQHRVVLCPPRKHLHGAADFLVAPDDRIELVLARQGRQVAAIFLQRLIRRLGVLAGDALVAAHLLHRGEKCVARYIQVAKNPRDWRVLLFVEHRQNKMLDRDVIILEFLRLVLRVNEKLVEAMRDANLPGRSGAADLRHAFESRLCLADHKIERDFQPFEKARHQSVFLGQKCVEKMFDINGLVAKARCLFLRGTEGGRRLFGKFI